MVYMIENVYRQNKSKGAYVPTSYVIGNEKILAVREAPFRQYTYMKIDGDPYVISPPLVKYVETIPDDMPNFFLSELILKGCLVFMTKVEISYKHQLKSAIQLLDDKLKISPIDYLLGVQLPLASLQPDMIRLLRKEKIPAVFVEITGINDLDDMPWGWVKEAFFPYFSTLIPIFKHVDNEKDYRLLQQKWVYYMKKHRLPYVAHPLRNGELINEQTQATIGIYPFKTQLQPGLEANYNFYKRGREITNIEELDVYHYHRERLVISCLRGRVLRAGDWHHPLEGFGKRVMIKTPSYYQLS
ncbi:hypothetical protein MKX67_14700 [Cytobacillus sp. FSL W7-1323]|uniref:hypothetical protein n=1 Tax=Cytobacillus TaxID=2675230 RepID=UPI002E1E8720|nr:hypothetical protein [Cytobacillus kochii]